MKKVLLLTLFFLCHGVMSLAQQSYNALSSVPLIDVLDKLESKNQIIFSYDSGSISDQLISLNQGNYTLQQVLDKVFKQTSLKFEFVDNKHVLLIKKSGKNELKFLCGYLKVKATNEPVIYATVYNASMTIAEETDQSGYFKINLSEEDEYISVSCLGYESLIISLAGATNDPCQDYFVDVASISFETVVLKEYLTDGINLLENAKTVVIEPEEMSVLPGSVEKDVMAAISFLPGITSPSESLDGIHVRGGTPDQNLILWDGIPMYHSSHFFGTISAFNPNIIDHVNVMRSGIGSQYGGRVSSVIDIHSEKEITDNFNMGAGFNLTHINLDLNIPLWKNSSLMISTRRSITDAWNTPTFIRYSEKVFQGTRVEESDFNDPQLLTSDEFKFNDANLKWMMDYGKNKFRFTSMGTLNSLDYKSNFEEWNVYSVEVLNLRNAGANFSWERQWNKKYRTKLEFTNAEYRNEYDFAFKRKENNTQTPFSYVSRNSITDGGLKLNNEWLFKENQKVNFGYHFTENKTSLTLNSVDRQDTSRYSVNFNNRVNAVYSDYSLNIPNTLQLDIGLRYLYQDILNNTYFEPRISLVTDVSERLKLKASTGKHFQFVSQVVIFNTNYLGLNDQFWIIAHNANDPEPGIPKDITIPVIESNQWMGGFIYKKGDWTLDVEGYVKELVGITTFSRSFFENNTDQFSSGNSRTRGIDFLLKKRIRNYRTWISYSISKTKQEFSEISDDPIIASHDQTYIFKWVNIYKKNNFEFSLGVEYRSGLPYSPATLEGDSIVYGTPNSLRLKRYFRVDGSIVYNFGSPETAQGFVSLSFQNIGNKQNILGRSYIVDEVPGNDLPVLLEINERGLMFTPNLSVNIRLN